MTGAEHEPTIWQGGIIVICGKSRTVRIAPQNEPRSHRWPYNFGLTANGATGICRRTPRSRASAPTSAPSAPSAWPPSCGTSARIAAGVFARGPSGPRPNGVLACPLGTIRRRTSGCIWRSARTRFGRSPRGCGTSRPRRDRSAQPQGAWGAARGGKGSVAWWRRHNAGRRGRSQTSGSQTGGSQTGGWQTGGWQTGRAVRAAWGFGIASRGKGFCASASIAVRSKRTSAPVKSIAVSSRRTKHRSRTALDALRGSGGPAGRVARICRMGAARSSTRKPALAIAMSTGPRRLMAVIVRSAARASAPRAP